MPFATCIKVPEPAARPTERTNNVEELVQGMRGLLSVLEAMILDIANY